MRANKQPSQSKSLNVQKNLLNYICMCEMKTLNEGRLPTRFILALHFIMHSDEGTYVFLLPTHVRWEKYSPTHTHFPTLSVFDEDRAWRGKKKKHMCEESCQCVDVRGVSARLFWMYFVSMCTQWQYNIAQNTSVNGKIMLECGECADFFTSYWDEYFCSSYTLLPTKPTVLDGSGTVPYMLRSDVTTQ